MKEAQQKNFVYNDLNERNKRMNRFYLPTSIFIWFLFGIYLWMKVLTKSAVEISYGYAIFNTVLIFAFSVSSFVVYRKQKSGFLLCGLVLVETAVEALVIGLKTEAEFIFILMFGVLIMLLPYYSAKLSKRFTVLYALIAAAILIVRMVIHPESANLDNFIKMLCIMAVIYVIGRVSRIINEFNDDALGAVGAQNKKQQEMLDNIMSISHTVAEESEKSTEVIEQLVGGAQVVDSSMKEITDAASLTAQSIEEQNTMTQSIRDAITDAGGRSKQMVTVAMESNEGIQTNITLMGSLKEQSVLIAKTNHNVSDAMKRLSDKTKAMEAIVDMILNISEQTNLLSLNASIESARAGEAGRGFAVVADQIRQLAEQTKVSTEEIAQIIRELNENANEVMTSVNDSVKATDEQGEKIIEAADTFEKLNENMTQLITGVNEIDQRILELTEANDKIVENITQVSATTEEVVASADQVLEISAKNMEYAEQVKAAIDVIRDNTEGLNDYL